MKEQCSVEKEYLQSFMKLAAASLVTKTSHIIFMNKSHWKKVVDNVQGLTVATICSTVASKSISLWVAPLCIWVYMHVLPLLFLVTGTIPVFFFFYWNQCASCIGLYLWLYSAITLYIVIYNIIWSKPFLYEFQSRTLWLYLFISSPWTQLLQLVKKRRKKITTSVENGLCACRDRTDQRTVLMAGIPLTARESV